MKVIDSGKSNLNLNIIVQWWHNLWWVWQWHNIIRRCQRASSPPLVPPTKCIGCKWGSNYVEDDGDDEEEYVDDCDDNDDELFALTITPWPVVTFQKVLLTEKVTASQNRNQFPPTIIRNDSSQLNIFCPLTIGKGSIEIYLHATHNDPEGGWGLPISHKRNWTITRNDD